MNSLVPSRPVSVSHIGPPSRSSRRLRSKNGQHRRSCNIQVESVWYVAGSDVKENSYPIGISRMPVKRARNLGPSSSKCCFRSAGVNAFMAHANGDSFELPVEAAFAPAIAEPAPAPPPAADELTATPDNIMQPRQHESSARTITASPPHSGRARRNASSRPSRNISVDEPSNELAISATTARLEGVEKLPRLLELTKAFADLVSLGAKLHAHRAARKTTIQNTGERSKLADPESQRTQDPDDSHMANRLGTVEPISGRC